MEGLDYVMAHREMFISTRSVGYGEILGKAIKLAAKNGVTEVLSTLESIKAGGLDSFYAKNVEFPEGFDFSALYDHAKDAELLKKGACFFGGSWMEQDSEGAFDALISDEAVSNFDQLFTDIPSSSRDSEQLQQGINRTKWLAEKFNDMQYEDAAEYATSLADSLKQQPEAWQELVNDLQEKEIRIDLIKKSFETTWNLVRLRNQLFTLKEPEDGVEVLERINQGPARYLFQTRQKLQETLDKMKVAPDRSDAILNRIFHP
ncbi:hypothetical protein JIN85_11120 [Luteolibacter pohnpeiensis]|uniref:Uncharacterized protein n=1 Tax=Luteolibacter pohnpeiensis TaxID=454153 RepID=A0A934SBQ1_9BACT|nr:hypothetical protein [Luteolibacter pohnpeiensis]MBK1882969.1 hypothetical protein [Luteolibacter pohnpeiensis]